jgi:predicted HTH transcriptional regulator
MKSITELEPAQRDALMFWVKDMEKKLFDTKIIITEDLFMDIPQETRRESYETVKPDAVARRRVILEILTEGGGMTAREVSEELHRRGITPTDERNYAAPRLTELYKAGKIKTTGKKLCPQTGRNVAVWAVRG